MAKFTREQRDAIKLFRDFRERDPTRIRKLSIATPEAVMILGPLEFVGYRTTHGRKSVLYTHDFSPGSRPLLCSGPDDNQLIIAGGRYRVTDRGIVDLSARGLEIDEPEHGEEVE